MAGVGLLRRGWPFILLILLVVAGYGIGRLIQDEMQLETMSPEQGLRVEGCDLSVQACSWLGYRLDVDRPVRPLTLITARLGSELPVESAVLYLEMQDMDMGINRFVFSPGDGGQWEAKVMIPVCATGRRDWLATLVITTDGQDSSFVVPLSVEGR